MSRNQKVLIYLLLYLSMQSAKANELEEANMRIYCNEYLPYGLQTHIVMTMEKLPVKSRITITLSTPSYLVAYFEVGKLATEMPPKFRRTSSISKELLFYGIKTKMKADYEEGYFALTTATFWSNSDKVLRLLGRIKLKRIYEIRKIIPIEVSLPRQCSPQLTIPRCSDPQTPRQLLISRGITINALFLETCNLTFSTIYNWSLSDPVGLTQFASYNSDNPYVNFRPYSLRFPNTYDLWRNFYVLQVEGKFNGLYFGARCYLKVLMGQVEAVILGGKSRMANANEVLWINGSLSYDFSKTRRDLQFSKYSWSCKSFDDNLNPSCHRNISSAAVFFIPAKSFKIGCRYVFSLKVTRDDDPNISSRKDQVVTMISNNALQVAIECERNCEGDYFNPKSKVHLTSRCSNCGSQAVRYKWYIDDQPMVAIRELIFDVQTVSNEIRVRLMILSEDGRYGRTDRTLIANIGPTGGSCSVYPKEGIEATTPFYPCCRHFVSMNKPIEFWYYAGSVLLGSCVDCNCEIYLPITNVIKVLACDVLWTCHTSFIKVKVTALKTIPKNMNSLPEKAFLHRYLQSIQSIASHITSAESGINMLRTFSAIQPQSESSLARLANLTITLAHRLYSEEQKKDTLLIKVVNRINSNFEEIYQNDDVSFLTREPFIDTRLACGEVYEIMKRLTQRTSRPPWPIYNEYYQAFLMGQVKQSLIDKLLAKIQALENEEFIYPWIIWLNSTWETERLHRHLNYHSNGLFRTDLIDERKTKQKVSLVIWCAEKIPRKPFRFTTSDNIHKVMFTPELIQEVLKTKKGRVCIKIVSLRQKLKWWYPLERQPSSLVLFVRIYRHYDNFTTQIPLNYSKFSYRTNISYYPEKFKAILIRKESKIKAGIYANCMREGTLASLQEVRMFRIMLMEHTLLAVHFVKATHKLQIVLKTKRPLFREISKSKCIVPAGVKHKILLLRNNCHKAQRAYIALRIFSEHPIKLSSNIPIKNGPASFAFVFQIRSCDTWSYKDPPEGQRWLQYGCYPSMDLTVKQGIRCVCNVLGTYTNYWYYIPVIKVPVSPYAEARAKLIIAGLYYAAMIALLVWIALLYLYRNKLPAKTIFIPKCELDDESNRDVHDILISLRTSGRFNAGTTASVTLVLYGPENTKQKIIIAQDPENIQLKQNSTYFIWIRTCDIRIPTKIMVSHDNAGRYPNWYLRRIEVTDMQTGETQVFLTDGWVTKNKVLCASDLIYRKGEVRLLDNKWNRFKRFFEMSWVNWSLWQPINGSWRESPYFPRLTRAKRFSIFLSKYIVFYTICATYFGPTTTESLQLKRSRVLNYKDIITLGIVCGVADIILRIVFQFVHLKWG